MNWKEFKEYVESKDVNDNTEITYIDILMYEPIVVFRDDENTAYIE